MHEQYELKSVTCSIPYVLKSNYSILSLLSGGGREFPGELERIRVWFQDYKIPDGKPANRFGFDNQPQNKEFTLNVRPAPIFCGRTPDPLPAGHALLALWLHPVTLHLVSAMEVARVARQLARRKQGAVPSPNMHIAREK